MRVSGDVVKAVIECHDYLAIQFRLLAKGIGLDLQGLWYTGPFESVRAGTGLFDLVFLLDDVGEQAHVRETFLCRHFQIHVPMTHQR